MSQKEIAGKTAHLLFYSFLFPKTLTLQVIIALVALSSHFYLDNSKPSETATGSRMTAFTWHLCSL